MVAFYCVSVKKHLVLERYRGCLMVGYSLSKKKKTGYKGKSKKLQARNNIAPEKHSFMSAGAPPGVDPVYALTNAFTKRFDALGMHYAGELSGKSSHEKSSFMSENGDSRVVIASRCKLHDSPEYAHSRQELNECQFVDRFSSYAFRGGKFANAVMAGQGKQMFTVCLSRALGRSFQGGERQKKLLSQTANERPVESMSSTVKFNRDAQSAVSIVTSAVRGSTRLLELFTKLANDSGQSPETPLEMRNIDTLKTAFPFLRTEEDRAAISACRARLKELEGGTKSPQTARILQSALVKQTAVLRRKEEQKRAFLTKLNEISSNVREAEKLFSSAGFAEQALNDAEKLLADEPPDDNKRRIAASEIANAVSDFLSGMRGEENGAAKPVQPVEAQRENLPAGEETKS